MKRKIISIAEPGYEGRRELRVVEVQDPWPTQEATDEALARRDDSPPFATIEVVVNLKENIIEWLFRHKHIDWPMKMAADRFRAIYERAGIVGATGIDYERPKVDGGQIARSGVSEAVMEAHKELAEIRDKLGPRHYEYLSELVGLGVPVKEFADRIKGKRPLRRTQEGVVFHLCYVLTDLVLHFTVALGPNRARIRAVGC